jgi:predicted Zn-dependent protease
MNELIRPRLYAVVFLVVSAAGVMGCATYKSVIAQASSVHKELEPAIVTDPQLENYLQSVGERIIASAKQMDAQHKGPDAHFKDDSAWMFSQNMKFHFVNSKTVNAFTTGGEHMYIYNALFQDCKSEDELAAVMAHEFAHVYCRHVQSGTNRQLPILVGGAVAGAAAGYAIGGKEHGTETALAGAGVGAAGGQFLNMGFTRSDEDQADEYGFDFYVRAGWDPAHFADFFKQMIAMGYDKTPEMLSDHPSLANRVKATEKRVKDLPASARQLQRPPIADPQQFAALKARANELAKKLPDDTKLANSQKLAQALPRSCVTPLEQPDAIQAREQLAQQAQQSKKKK